MTRLTDEDLAKRELSTDELDTITAGVNILPAVTGRSRTINRRNEDDTSQQR